MKPAKMTDSSQRFRKRSKRYSDHQQALRLQKDNE